MAHPGGRPSTYTHQIGLEICNVIATSTLSLKKLCKMNPNWPCKQTILEWRLKIKEFGDLYHKAKCAQVEALVDDCLDISDDITEDAITKIDKDGEQYEVCNNEWVNRSRLRIETRKWLAAKLSPRLYGDKDVEDKQEKLSEEINDIRKKMQKCMKEKKK